MPPTEVLAPYQLNAIDWLTRNSKCVLGSEPGTGKTAVALHAPKGERAVIVVPSFLLDNWSDEIKKWLPDVPFQLVRTGATKLKPGMIFYITTYTLALKLKDQILKLKIPYCILDESHYIKNPETDRTKGYLHAQGGLLRFFDIVWMLTGTPFPQHLIDCHTTFNFCLKGALGKYWDFAQEYCYIKFIQRGSFQKRVAVGKRREKEPQLIQLVKPILHRDRLCDISDQLPDFRFNPVSLEHTKETRQFCNDNAELMEKIKDAIEAGHEPPTSSPLSTVRKEWGLVSVQAKLPFIENILEQGTFLVVFCWHREVAQKIGSALRKRFKVAVATGDTPGPERHLLAKRFQDGEFNVMVATIASMGTGINLTRASEAVFAEEGWSPLHREQGTGRLRRMTQKSFCMFHFPMLPNSLDRTVYYSVGRKSENVDGFWRAFRGEKEAPIAAEEINWND